MSDPTIDRATRKLFAKLERGVSGSRSPGWLGVIVVPLVAGGWAFGYWNYVYMPRIPQLLPVSGHSIPLAIFSPLIALVLVALLTSMAFAVLRARSVSGFELLVAGICDFGIGTGAGTLHAIQEWTSDSEARVEEGIAWCDQVRELLERHRSVDAEYPTELSLLELPEPRPKLAETGDIRYERWDDTYQLEVNVSRGLMFAGARFDRSRGTWERYE